MQGRAGPQGDAAIMFAPPPPHKFLASLSGSHRLRSLPPGLKDTVFLAPDTKVNWEESSDISVNTVVSARMWRSRRVCVCVCVLICG